MTHTNVASRIHLSLACAAVFGFCTTNVSSFDISGKEFSDLKIAKPLRKRGAGASGEIEKRGNHEGDEFNIPGMIKNENHSHSTSLPTISNSDTSVNPQTPQSPFRRGFVELLQSCNIFKFEMQGEGA